MKNKNYLIKKYKYLELLNDLKEDRKNGYISDEELK